MKAIVCTKYGSPEVLQIKELEKPIPGDYQVLIKVVAASLTTADSMIRRGTPFYGRFFIGLLRPKRRIPGTGFAGEIEAVGKKVSLFKKGDAVFGETGLDFGAHAQYVCLGEDSLMLTLPANMSFEEAAPICDGALTSWCFLKDIGKIHSGQHVLIILNSSVGQGIECFCGGVGQGVTARNGHSLSSSYNAAIRHHRSAIYSVAPFTYRVKGIF